MKLTRRKPSRNAQLFEKSRQAVDRSLAVWDRIDPFQRRVLLKKMGMRRSLYKYRAIPTPDDTVGRQRLEDFLVDNRLWLGAVSGFNDPFEGQADYVVHERGADLRRALERKYVELGFTSQAAKAKVDSADVADPVRIEQRARAANLTVLGEMGVCALGTNPSSPLMWAHYAYNHTGICVQLRPVMDLGALLAEEVEYSDTYPVLDDILKPGESRNVLPIMRKSSDWAYEKEWRIVAQEEPNSYRAFAPRALSAVILGMRISDPDKTYVLGLMDERERRYGVRPVLYQAAPARQRYRVEIRRLQWPLGSGPRGKAVSATKTVSKTISRTGHIKEDADN